MSEENIEKKCGTCVVFISTFNKCALKGRTVNPDAEGCETWDSKEAVLARGNNTLQKSAKKKKRGGRKSKIIISRLIELYNEGATYRAMADKFDLKSETEITYQINKLIESGELSPRKHNKKGALKKMTEEPTNKPPKKSVPRETPTNTACAESESKDNEDKEPDIPEDIITDEEALEQLTKYLMTGADKIVVYRDGTKLTIEPDKESGK